MKLSDLNELFQSEEFEVIVDNAKQFTVGSWLRLRCAADSTVVYISADSVAPTGIDLQNIHGKFATEHYADNWRRIQNCKYYAEVLSVYENRIRVLALYAFIETDAGILDIAITDKQVKGSTTNKLRRPEDVKQHILTDYVLMMGNDTYIVVAKNRNSDKEAFILANGTTCYSVKEYVRRELGVTEAGKEESNQSKNANKPSDIIWAINSGERPLLKKEEYSFELWKCQLNLADETASAKQREATKAFLDSGIDKYLTVWKQYTELEFKIMERLQNRAGTLHYSKTQYDLGTGKYTLTIKNDQIIVDFVKILAGCGNERKVDVSTIYTNQNGKQQDSFALATLCGYNGSTIEVQIDDAHNRPKPAGDVKLSIVLSKAQHDRRMNAVERIENSQSAKPNLAMLISGQESALSDVGTLTKNTRIAPFTDAVYKCFPNGMPTQTQKNAVSMAVNTPDFAIIQGPPGTGKTTVINAIMQALSEQEKDPQMAYGKNLLTAYQRDTTTHLAEKMLIYGLPAPIYKGMSNAEDEKIRDSAMTEWIRNKRDELREGNPDVSDLEASDNLFNQLTLLKLHFDVEQATHIQAKETLEALKHAISECAETERLNYKKRLRTIQTISIDEMLDGSQPITLRTPTDFSSCKENLERLLHRTQAWRGSDVQQLDRWYIERLPTSEAAMSDNGQEIVAGVARLFVSESYDEKIKKGVRELNDLYACETIPYSKIRLLKNILLVAVSDDDWRKIDIDFNGQVMSLIDGVIRIIENKSASEEQKLLAHYHSAFDEDNDEALREWLSEFMTVIAATHQKAVSKTVMSHKGLTKDDSLHRAQGAEEASAVEYDNVLIDEAARSCPPDLLIPLACAKNRMILVGDQKQLPQFISDNVYAQLDGYSKTELDELVKKTMFERLIEQVKKLEARDHIQRYIMLNEQYRMPKTLGDIVSKHFYADEGGLLSPLGNDERHTISDLPFISGMHLAWLDVAGANQQRSESGSYSRRVEAEAVVKMIAEMLENADSADKYTYAIITFYSAQKELIDKLIKQNMFLQRWNEEHSREEKKIKCYTVDSYQGMESDVIFLSLVRSLSSYDRRKNAYGYITNKNRQCVALSRAKRCLVIAGDKGMVTGARAADAQENIPAIAEIYKLCRKESVTDACVLKA